MAIEQRTFGWLRDTLTGCKPNPEASWADATQEAVGLLGEYRDCEGYPYSVSRELVRETARLLLMSREAGLPPPLFVSPTYGGCAMVEWHFDDSRVYAAELRETGRAEVLHNKPGGGYMMTVVAF